MYFVSVAHWYANVTTVGQRTPGNRAGRLLCMLAAIAKQWDLVQAYACDELTTCPGPLHLSTACARTEVLTKYSIGNYLSHQTSNP